METLIGDESLLDFLVADHNQSPEDFLLWLEDELENGMSFDDAQWFVNDYMRTMQ